MPTGFLDFIIPSEEHLEVLTHRLVTQSPNPNAYGIHISYMLGNTLDHI